MEGFLGSADPIYVCVGVVPFATIKLAIGNWQITDSILLQFGYKIATILA